MIAGDRWSPYIGTERRGPHNQPKAPILMLHGGAQTRHSWDRAARELSLQGHEVTTIDARGHGESDWSPIGDYSLESLAADLVMVVEQRYPDGARPVLVGASLGGLTSLIALGQGHDVGQALVLVDVSTKLEARGIDRVGDFMRSGIEGFDSLEQVAAAVAAYQPHRPQPKSTDGLRKNLRQAADGRWYWHWDPVFARSADGTQAELGEAYLEDFARRVEVPTMLLRGSESDVIAKDAGDRLRELIPHVYTHEVQDAGHMLVGDDNAVFLDNMQWFLAQLL